MVPHGDDSQAMNSGTTELLRRPLPTRAYQLHPAPHFCGYRKACQVNGRMCVGSFNRRVPRMNGKIRMHGAFTIPVGMLGLKQTDQSCHHDVWIHLLHVRLVDRK